VGGKDGALDDICICWALQGLGIVSDSFFVQGPHLGWRPVLGYRLVVTTRQDDGPQFRRPLVERIARA